MNWFISKLVFRIKQQGYSTPQFDEQWRMINAINMEEAMEKAETIGHLETEEMTRVDGQSFGWEFIAITDLFPFSADQHGNEVFSRIEQPDNEAFYLKSVHEKAKRFENISA